jgi:hypothetical protein
MSMNFKFSRGYGQCQAVQSVGGCCYSNTKSAEVVLEQQWAIARSATCLTTREDCSAFYGKSRRS